MRFSAVRLATVLTLVSLVLVGVAAPATGQTAAETTVMQVSLQSDGDARWTVSARFALSDGNESAAFDRLADEFVAGESSGLSVEPFQTAASMASEATAREMAITTVDRTASQGNGTGALRLSFTWTNFARVEDDGQQLVLGDVFTTPSGTWLPGLEDHQVLVIEFPPGYVVESVSRGLDNRSIRVTGPATFQPGEPSATLERSEPVSSPTPPNSGVGVPSALTAGAALAILLAIAFLLYRRREGSDEEAPSDEPPDEPADEFEKEEPLLSDEERVLRLLQAEGGRMKQVDIVDETDWSNAKVSQLLSSMAEEGHIEKLRIGRENLISLPDDGDD